MNQFIHDVVIPIFAAEGVIMTGCLIGYGIQQAWTIRKLNKQRKQELEKELAEVEERSKIRFQEFLDGLKTCKGCSRAFLSNRPGKPRKYCYTCHPVRRAEPLTLFGHPVVFTEAQEQESNNTGKEA